MPRGKTLAACGPDVVLVEDAQTLDADDPRERGDRRERERRDRQDVRGEARAPRDGEHVDRDGEEVDERRRRAGTTGSRRAPPVVAVKPSSTPRRRLSRVSAAISTPSGTATKIATRNAMPASLSVAGRALLDHVGDALAGRQRRPEVAVQDVADVVHVLRRRAACRARARPSAPRRGSRGAVGPSAARTGSPGTRWIMKNVAVRSSASETSEPRRAANEVGRPCVRPAHQLRRRPSEAGAAVTSLRLRQPQAGRHAGPAGRA